MKKIRRGMFETNSSSTHTIIIADEKFNKGSNEGCMVDFRIGEFGWETRTYYDTDAKASYLYTAACSLLGRDVYQELYEVLSKYGIMCMCAKPAVFKDYGSGKYLDNGYIDHVDGLHDFVNSLMSHEKLLMKYLFDERSFIHTTNDNTYEYERHDECLENLKYRHKEFYKGN